VAQLSTLGVMDTLLPALIVSAISALTFIAYKHPDGYARIHFTLRIGTACISVLLFIFLMGYSIGFYSAANGYLKSEIDKTLSHPEI